MGTILTKKEYGSLTVFVRALKDGKNTTTCPFHSGGRHKMSKERCAVICGVNFPPKEGTIFSIKGYCPCHNGWDMGEAMTLGTARLKDGTFIEGAE